MLTSTANVKRHTENGVTTDFPFDFKVDSPTELEVDSIDLAGVPTRLSYPGDFTVTGLHDNDGGYITKVAGTNGFDLLIRRITPTTQTTKLRGQTELDPVVLEDALDKLAKVDQQHAEELTRTFRSSVEGIDTELPEPEAGYALGWDATGTKLVNVPNTGADQSADLADTASSVKGAGMVGYDGTHSYEPDTVGDHLNSISASPGSSLVGFLQSGTGAVARTVQAKLYETVSVTDYTGCDPTGATYSDSAFSSAITRGGRVRVPQGYYKFQYGLAVDISLCGLTGDGTVILDFSDVASGQAIQVYSSKPYGIESGTKNNQNKIAGITFIGNTAIDGALLGKVGAGYTMSHEMAFEDCQFYTFRYGVNHTDNAWRSQFRRCGFEDITTDFIHFDAHANSGEAMMYDNCYFCNGIYGAGMFLNYGQWHFRGCSFPAGGDTGAIWAQGSAHVTISGCNLETQPQSADHAIVKANGTPLVVVKGCTILTNEDDFTVPYFNINDGSRLVLSCCTLPLYGYMQTELTNPSRSLVNGTSARVSLDNNHVYGGGSTDKTKWAVVSNAANAIVNGDAETNSVAMWDVSAPGGSSFASVTTSPKNGARHYAAIGTAGNYAEASQKIPLSPGDCGRVIVVGMWAKHEAGPVTDYYPSISFYAANGALISTYGAIAIDPALSTYTWIGEGTIIPPGSGYAVLRIGAGDGNTVYYDDIVVNVI